MSKRITNDLSDIAVLGCVNVHQAGNRFSTILQLMNMCTRPFPEIGAEPVVGVYYQTALSSFNPLSRSVPADRTPNFTLFSTFKFNYKWKIIGFG
ncbi:hypothetical protein AVEN_158513-1 [Araneus ventricosus]|uniref:Uncharacterized protein n=1 Tax=Araneus ventricosus TaxID=182803 RepID=A0A4Y1ZWB7_ARAVE|nr:hypothetical protein AVEN_158513-1 [Araneus ventricosus]